jgi:hypothetical protein
MRTARVYGREREREMGKVVERREEAEGKKKGRLSLLDVRKQQQKRTHSATTCPNPDADELDSDNSENSVSDSDESFNNNSWVEADKRNGRARVLCFSSYTLQYISTNI